MKPHRSTAGISTSGNDDLVGIVAFPRLVGGRDQRGIRGVGAFEGWSACVAYNGSVTIYTGVRTYINAFMWI